MFFRKKANRPATVMLPAMATCALVVAGIAASSPAGAGEVKSYGDIADRIFQSADRDGDGILTGDEFASAGLDKFGVELDVFDENADGTVVSDEYRAVCVRCHNAAHGRDA